MKIAIEASNIGSGGGITHLREVMTFAQPGRFGIEKIEIWARKTVLSQLPDKGWLKKSHHSLLEKGIVGRTIWQTFIFPGLARNYDVLFLPAGNPARHKCAISMSQNLLPFEDPELNRYGLSPMRLRLMLVRWSQKRSFRHAKGVIMLSEYARHAVCQEIGLPIEKTTVINHGVHPQFNQPAKRDYGRVNTVSYVSTIDVYKHQWKVVEACFLLWDKGFDFDLNLVGSSYPPSLKHVLKVIQSRPEYVKKIKILNGIRYTELPQVYNDSDVFVYASTCETFGLTVLEAMANGLPIACSDASSMKEILLDCGLYFDALNVVSISESMGKLLRDQKLRQALGTAATSRAKKFDWQGSSDQTFQFMLGCAK